MSAVPKQSKRIAQTLFLVLGLVSAVHAQIFTVNTETDITDATPGNGICAAANGQCSIRAAIMEANALPGADTVILTKRVYTISIPGQNEDNTVTGDLDILDDLSIRGEGANNSIIDGGQLDRVLDIRGNVNVSINGITVRHGKTDLNNYDQNNNGGGLVIEGRSIVTIRGSAISNNSADIGGGLSIKGGAQADVTIESTIISNNMAISGGGVAAGGGPTIHFINTTVSGNKASFLGGGLFTSAFALVVINSTITNNTALASGAGLFTSGQVTLRNSILANNYLTNTTDASNCYSTSVYSAGYNIVGNNRLCTFEATSSDIVGTPSNPIDPLLGPLANNGGPTFTHALLPNSPAIDAGNPLPSGRGGGACELTDQRGESRASHAPCDIGSYETTNGGDTWLSAVIAPNTQPNRQRVQYQLTVGNNGTQRIRQLTLTLTLPRNSQQTTITGENWTCTLADNIYTCLRESLNTGTQSVLTAQLTPPPNTKEITLEAHIETISQDSTPANNQVTLTTVINRPPRVLTQGHIRYDIHGKPIPLAPNLTIEDEDDTRLKSATVRFTEGYRNREDRLTTPATATLITRWQADQATLTLTGDDTLSAYEQALRQVRYDNTAADPTRHTRLLEISVNDTYADSNPAPVELEIAGEALADANINSGGIVNPFVSETGTMGGVSPRHHAPANASASQKDSESADKGKSAGQKGEEKPKKEASARSRLLEFFGVNEKTEYSGWPLAGSIDNASPWLTAKSIAESSGGIERKIVVVSASVAFAAGAINLYMRSGAILGWLFSFPLWGSVDPIHVLMVSNRERKRRNKEIHRERRIEDQVDRVGRYFEE